MNPYKKDLVDFVKKYKLSNRTPLEIDNCSFDMYIMGKKDL